MSQQQPKHPPISPAHRHKQPDNLQEYVDQFIRVWGPASNSLMSAFVEDFKKVINMYASVALAAKELPEQVEVRSDAVAS